MPILITPPARLRLTAKAAVLALLCPVAPLMAQEAGPGGQSETATQREASSLQRVDVVSRQGSTELRRAASVAKQIYGREELDKYGDTNVLDVMRRLPGVNIGADGPRMRGLGAGYTQILINGDPTPPGFRLDQLSPAQIERIEVLRAPTADQSAQAVAGTINIILKEAPRRSERLLRVGLSDGVDRPRANANLIINEGQGGNSMSIPISVFEWQRENKMGNERKMPGTDGLPAFSTQEGLQQVWGYGFNVGPRFTWKSGEDRSLTLQTFAQKGWWNNRSDYVSHVFSGQPVLDEDSRQHGTWQNLNANLNFVNRFAGDQRIELRAGVRQQRWFFDSRSIQSDTHAVGGGTDEGMTQSGKYNKLLGESHSLTAGWDLELRRRNEERTVTKAGVPLLGDFEGQPFKANLRRQAVYVQDEWDISPNWQLYLGLRHERIRTEGESAGAPVLNESAVTSPLAHLTWRIDPKGRDMVRASLTRSYKAANLGLLLARPSVNGAFLNTNVSNTELTPDRIGNPTLRPELATGLDIAFEKYLPGGGMWSLGMFRRNLTDVVRNVTTLQTVSWATAPRWVSSPVNFSAASTTGIEFELRGRAAEFFPSWFDKANTLNLRTSINLYRSSVAALPGPNNRLDGQQPWAATFGFDQRISGLPLSVGGSLSLNPAYDTQLTLDQTIQRSTGRTLDLYGQWIFRPGLSARLAIAAGVQPFGPTNGWTRTVLSNGDYSQSSRRTNPQINFTVDMRL